MSETDKDFAGLTLLLDIGGHVTIGRVAPIEGVAIAATRSKVLVSLKRAVDENAESLLRRLDAALMDSMASGAPIDEVRQGQFVLQRPSIRRRG